MSWACLRCAQMRWVRNAHVHLCLCILCINPAVPRLLESSKLLLPKMPASEGVCFRTHGWSGDVSAMHEAYGRFSCFKEFTFPNPNLWRMFFLPSVCFGGYFLRLLFQQTPFGTPCFSRSGHIGACYLSFAQVCLLTRLTMIM